MDKVIENTDIRSNYRADFEVVSGLYGRGGRMNKLRQDAMEFFEQSGFPTKKNEEWKYTDVSHIANTSFRYETTSSNTNLSPEEINNFLIGGKDVQRLVFINGHYNEQLSEIKDDKSIRLETINENLKDELVNNYFNSAIDFRQDAFTALNSALAYDGAFVVISANAQIEKPIHIININDSRKEAIASHSRNLIIAEKGCKASFILSYHSYNENNSGLTNAATEIFCQPNSNVEVDIVQTENEDNSQVNNLHVVQERDSVLSVSTISLSGRLIRNNLHVKLNGTNCETHLYGLYLASGNQLIDNHTFVDHAMPHCESNELYKGVAADKATAVFNGKVFVRPDAQKTNAFQENKSILLSDDANIYTKPQLEIYADDVKCSHGATTGQLDEDAMFYLRSRGIGEDKARALLINAFAQGVIDKINIPVLRENRSRLIEQKLNKLS
ncbi:MAG: Fe-S cluster assembly protein SufD [Bacteroidia bacterium]